METTSARAVAKAALSASSHFRQSLRASLGKSSGDFIDSLEEKEAELTRDMAMRIELVSSEAREATQLAENYLEDISTQRVSLHYRRMLID